MYLSSLVATLHSARRHFGSMDITGQTFLELRGTPYFPADHLLFPASIISFFSVPVPFFLSPLCFRTAGSDRGVNRTVLLWLSVLNRCLFIDWQEERQAFLITFWPQGVDRAWELLLCSGQYKFSSWPVLERCTHSSDETLGRFLIIQDR